MFRTSRSAPALILTVITGIALAEPGTNIYESTDAAKPKSELDRIVFGKLKKLGIQPVLCSDSVFVRRAYLDVLGTLPTTEEARQFIDDANENKRVVLIDQLLKRDEFADYWSMKWGDVLRIKAEFPINLWPNAAQAYHRWVRQSIVENKPYDQFVREMLTSSGSNFRVGPVNFYRAIQNKTPNGIATSVALTFMGARAESWPEDRLEHMSVFFSQIGYKPTSEWKEESVFWDPLKSASLADSVAPGNAKVTTVVGPSAKEGEDEESETIAPPSEIKTLVVVLPDGAKVKIPPNKDPREVFADWLIAKENPWFTKSIVNRVWAWLLGRGIIHEPDDIRDDNPGSNSELLAYLEKELIEHNYDLKHLYRLVLTSQTYQLASTKQYDNPEAVANFASYPLRRLEAEVLIDAINKITGTTDLYTSAIPEPFTYIPRDMPAIAVADGSITSPFLALFGRSARATGMENERKNKLGSSQWLHMLNSSHIQTKLESSPKLRALLATRGRPEQKLEKIYLTVLSRRPTPEEAKAALSYGLAPNRMSRNDWIDVTWALINSPEFLYRH